MNESPRSWRRVLSDPEMLVAISALVISLCAVVLSGVQVFIMRDEQHLMREEQHMSVWPRLEVNVVTRINDPEVNSFLAITTVGVDITVQNKGVGPALVQGITVLTDAKQAAGMEEAITRLFPGKSFQGSSAGIVDRTLLPGETVTLVTYNVRSSQQQVAQNLGRLHLQICYCSVYNDCWTVAINRLGEGKGRTPFYQPASACQYRQ